MVKSPNGNIFKSSVKIPRLSIKNEVIELVKNVKYLGFNIDSRLNHNVHLRDICARLSRLKNITRKIKSNLSIDAARTLYFGLVQSIASYGILIWGGTVLDSSWSTRVHKLQNKVFNLFAGPNDSYLNMSQIYLICKILKFIDHDKINACRTIYKVLNENYVNFLHEKLFSILRQHEYDTRHRSDILLPFSRVQATRRNFLYQGIKCWNNLDGNIKISTNSKVFKSVLKRAIIDGYDV